MTKFDKKLFNFHGGYLTYTGDYEGRPKYENRTCVHPTRIGKGRDLFVCRFKYKGPITKAKFVKQLLKSFTVEQYVAKLKEGLAPIQILRDDDPDWYQNIMS